MTDMTHRFVKGDVCDDDDSPAVLHDGQLCRIIRPIDHPDGWDFGPKVQFEDGTFLLVREDEVTRHCARPEGEGPECLCAPDARCPLLP